MNIQSSLTTALAAALKAASDVTSAYPWEAREVTPENNPVRLASGLTVALHLQGALEGTLYLCPDESASRRAFAIAEELPTSDIAAKWQALCEHAAKGFVERCLESFGAVQVTGCQVQGLPTEALPWRSIFLGQENENPGWLFLLSDATLQRSVLQLQGTDRGTLALSAQSGRQAAPLDRVIDVPLSVKLRFGKRQLSLRELLELNTGSLVELDQPVEEPVHLMLGDRLIARGEVVIVDGNYGLRVLEVVESVHARAGLPS